MKLIGSHTSPFVRKVRIVLAEKKIDVDFEIDSPWLAESKVPDNNPLGKIPVLLLDDGTPLFDSRVIVEYIDNLSPNNKLFPAPNRERTEVKRWEALADGICEAATGIVMEKRRPAHQQGSDWIQRQRGKLERGLDFMAEHLGDKTYCMGNHISMADIAAGTALGYLDFRFTDMGWQETYPNLERLYGKLMQRASFAETLPHD
ncbi:MAG: glutathione S-transferase [Azonexus sp.]|nr:glutathione S-transferase [Azonexus sp.]MCK6411694.1 glutathione S-transferase [Azonexus sp.]